MIKTKLKTLWWFAVDVFREFVSDNGTLFAAAISFFGIISLIPILVLAIGVFGFVLDQKSLFHHVVSFLSDYLPVSTTAIEIYLKELSKQSSVLSLIGILGLLWAGSQVFVIMQQVMNLALHSERNVSFVRGRTMAFVLVLLVWVLFALSIGITSLLAAAKGATVPLTGIRLGNISWIWKFFAILIPTVISAMAFAFIYKFSPTRNVGTVGPLIGGGTAGVLFEIAKHAFRWYVVHYANFPRIYGSLGTIIVLVVWIYYVSLIAVIGGEVTSVYARDMERRGVSRR